MEPMNRILLSIPPYFATSWDEVAALHASDNTLHIYLKSGQEVILPNISSNTRTEIFSTYSQILTKAEGTKKLPLDQSSPDKSQQDEAFESIQKGLKEVLSLTMKLGASAIGQLGAALEHNPAHSQLPPLPPEMIPRIQVLSNVIPKDDLEAMPPPVDNCFCLYCQIQRIIRGGDNSTKHSEQGHPNEKEEIVDDTELEFSEWEVTPIADKLYSVINKLDPKEAYRVFLGEPMGCTCGKPHCEHIVAVLRS